MAMYKPRGRYLDRYGYPPATIANCKVLLHTMANIRFDDDNCMHMCGATGSVDGMRHQSCSAALARGSPSTSMKRRDKRT
jgi:hypothetical protein